MGEDESDYEKTMVVKKDDLGKKSPDHPYLVVLRGPHVGQTFRLDPGGMVIGRDEDADLALFDGRISRRHALVSVEDKEVFIEDLGSSNGTYVNGQRLTKPHALRDGDKIQLGGTHILKFSYEDALTSDFHKQMAESAMRDPLTHAYNRRFFLDRLAAELRFADRHKAPVSVAMLDVDRFKAVNDTHGHPIGDVVLKAIAKTIQKTIRAEDIFARYGGEEFVLLCRASDASQTEVLTERVRRQIADTPVTTEAGLIKTTISIGIASVPQLSIKSALDLLSAADGALYEAKNDGRNCTRIASARRDTLVGIGD